MRIAHVHRLNTESSDPKKVVKSSTIEVDIKPIRYLEDLGLFDDEKEASIYHKTVKQVMAVQSKHKGIQTLREMLADKIKEFNELVH